MQKVFSLLLESDDFRSIEFIMLHCILQTNPLNWHNYQKWVDNCFVILKRPREFHYSLETLLRPFSRNLHHMIRKKQTKPEAVAPLHSWGSVVVQSRKSPAGPSIWPFCYVMLAHCSYLVAKGL